MAWPLTPIQTFLANVTRWTAPFANQLQAGVNGIVAGTYSLIGVVVDGTGGATVTPVPGALTLSSAAGSTTVPSPTTVSRKVTYGDMQPFAMAIVDQTGGTAVVKWGVNVAGIANNGGGDWTIQLKTAAPALARMGAIACAMVGGNTANAIPQDTTHVRVTTFNMVAGGGALQNSAVMLLVYAGD
jgi:hypothetical protein